MGFLRKWWKWLMKNMTGNKIIIFYNPCAICVIFWEERIFYFIFRNQIGRRQTDGLTDGKMEQQWDWKTKAVFIQIFTDIHFISMESAENRRELTLWIWFIHFTSRNRWHHCFISHQALQDASKTRCSTSGGITNIVIVQSWQSWNVTQSCPGGI